MAAACTNLLLAARAVGVECVVAAPDHRSPDDSPGDLVRVLSDAGVRVQLLPTMPWPARAAYAWGLSPAQAVWVGRNISGFDLVHVHGIWGVGPLSGLAAGRLAGKPVVVTAHESLTSFDIDDSRSAPRRRQKLLLKSLYLRYATLFVLTSQLEARDSLPPEVPQRTVHYPIVHANGSVPPPPPRGRQRELTVGFVARIDPKKNLGLLIDAMADLPEHVRLVIAGDGPPDLVQALRTRADESGAGDRIEWLGFVEPRERDRLLARLDVLAMPSVFESFGLSAAEAMLEGVPVLVSERTGIAEVIRRRGGGRIAAADTPSVVEAIRALDADRDGLSEMGRHGQAAIREELDYRRIGEALLESYEAALRSSARPAAGSASTPRSPAR